MPLIHVDESAGISLMWRVEVPHARVWQCLTDAGLLSQWQASWSNRWKAALNAFDITFDCRLTAGRK